MKKTQLLLWPSIFLVFLAVGWGRAWGVQLVDSKSNFSVDLDFPGASVCVAYPSNLRNDKNCEGVNIPAPEKDTEDFTLLGTGVIRFKRYAVSFYAQATLVPRAGPVNEKIGKDYLKGFLEGTNKRIKTGPVSQIEGGLVTVKSQPVYRFLGDQEMPGSQHLRFLYYVFSGKDHRYAVILITGVKHEQELQAFGIKFMDRVIVSPPVGSYEAENADWRSKSWGKIFDGLYHLFIGGFFIWLLWKLGKVMKDIKGR